MDDAETDAGGDPGVDGVAAGLEDAMRCQRGEGVTGGDSVAGPERFRAGGPDRGRGARPAREGLP